MDARDREAMTPKWYESIDERAMQIVVLVDEEPVRFPMKFEVCDLCSGRGKHVNPSIDAHGISPQEFAEDPDFGDDYMRGIYDVACYRCHGSNVEPVIDESDLSDELQTKLVEFRAQQRAIAEMDAIEAAERRMGC